MGNGEKIFIAIAAAGLSAVASLPVVLAIEQKSSNELHLYGEARTTKDKEKVLSDYNWLVEINPREYLGERARFFAEIGDTSRAEADYDSAVKLDPDLWLMYRAYYWGTHENLSRALEDYQALIDLKTKKLQTLPKDTPDYRWALHELARPYWRRAYMYELHGDFDSALSDYRHAATIAPVFMINYAEFSEKRGLTDCYLEALNSLVKQAPEQYVTRRAEFYGKRGEYVKAKADYDEAVRVSRRFGVKDGYSPLAWALQQRSKFLAEHGNAKAAEHDKRRSETLARLQQKLFGFSSWPTYYPPVPLR